MRMRSSLARNVHSVALGGAAAVLALIYRSFCRMGDLSSHAVEFIGLALLAGVIFVCAVYVVEHYPCGRWSLGIILGGALGFRLLLLPLWPSLSQDLYRYRWQGRAQQEGLNPYTVTPATPGLEHLRDETYQRMGTPNLHTVYPPLAEGMFAWNFRLAPSVVGFKSLFVLLDLASLVVLLLLLRTRKLPLTRVIAYAWNPLVVTSFAASGHYDSMAMVTLLLALLFIIGRRPVLSTAFLALSVLTKFFAVLLLPAVLKTALRGEAQTRPAGARSQKAWAAAKYVSLFMVLVGFAYLPYVAGGAATVFEGLDHFIHHYENNDSLFRVIRYCGNSHMQAQLVAGVLLALLVGWSLKNWDDPLKTALLVTAAVVLLSPNSFPWYFTWSMPFLCFHPNSAWLLMSVTATLGYAPLVEYDAGGVYRDRDLFLWLEYGPVFALAAGQFLYRGIKSGGRLKPER